FDRPLACRFQARRAGEAQPVDVGEEVQRPHDLRMLLLLLTDLIDDLRIEALLCRNRDEETGKRRNKEQFSEHEGGLREKGSGVVFGSAGQGSGAFFRNCNQRCKTRKRLPTPFTAKTTPDPVKSYQNKMFS